MEQKQQLDLLATKITWTSYDKNKENLKTSPES